MLTHQGIYNESFPWKASGDSSWENEWYKTTFIQEVTYMVSYMSFLGIWNGKYTQSYGKVSAIKGSMYSTFVHWAIEH